MKIKKIRITFKKINKTIWNYTCKLLLVASFSKLELFTTFERFLVSWPSSSNACKRKKCRPTANLRKASPSSSSLSRENRSWHFSVVSASRTLNEDWSHYEELLVQQAKLDEYKFCQRIIIGKISGEQSYSLGSNLGSFREWST